MKVYFKTFGCRTNIYDSEIMKNSINFDEICNDESLADTIVVNSCTVTNGADSDVRTYISRMKRAGKRVLLTGCGAVFKGKELLDDGKVDGVFGMSRKLEISDFLKNSTKFYEFGDSSTTEKGSVTNFSNHSKAFLKIQEGCNFKCSYCIIPHVRGIARSESEEKLLNEAKNLVENGFCEIVLTGTNIGSYGSDSGTNLGELLKKLSLIKGIKRIRLGSLEPSQIDDSFREILKESWLERHLHIALQHTSQKMLSLMRRRNTAIKDIELFCELSDMGFALGTDFIVGHPGESDEIWSEALSNFKKFPLTHIHAFIYSKRDGTRSAELLKEFGEINGKISKQRLKEIQNIVNLNNLEFRKKLYNEPLNVLFEQKNGEFWSGFDQFYNRVYLKSDQDLRNKFIEVRDYEIKDSGNFAKA
ncbi:putative tRNA (N6-L-threonylcarbamoyladenosine37-C2)-methylthiotransferase MtaB [Campylobacter corcagiensis]|uniref:tRNA (N(6)-L-threonylcarbamoyladenosine(37)-C(2))-methylthiotransferase MtaB n=2 Tax=Campylobacter corcagiensis TaxID=1448857 RepID=A0A7M1LEQ2_9BACT|nr:tRNA (N(6)-L-threonylcarbamoyladenosine(37)-C(2))-methylthiotransferase MtaB [Campylobacter corcagiensis]QKF64788.1 putative tRNA (N6-L-threonylcarbamoyladenosine37-C2)-methylthiotransferase MtaB [Campylobacter corcagiensis]QOQ87049.1 tRNA (N(6)-L-threonylcarbamoyladenosine(37)-C(2))-methylthiotransferase MtaB [Campylobacter corcagiensis]